MSDEPKPGKFELAPELVAVQNQLANLTPKALRVDRDQLMFNAGRAAERTAATNNTASRAILGPDRSRTHRFWPATTATMTAATVLLSAILLRQPVPLPIANQNTTQKVTTVAVAMDSPSKPTFSRTWISPPTTGYLGARNIALSRGVSALATQSDSNIPTSSTRPEPATARELRNELLPDTRQRS